ncbi:MAG: muraminidase [Bacteroidetes bacterium HGW-Bacteroidetes-1]|jgi:lysozyme|nr:MAG: muraminidase [Bacteroidetes bacterium HGW-Bacteroidetes-1]
MKCPKCGYTDEVKPAVSHGLQIPPHISDVGLQLIKAFEGKHNKGYLCPANVWTIGYGHTGPTLGKPTPQGMTISDFDAETLLKKDMAKFEDVVTKHVKVPLSQNQFDALVSFTFNVGAGAFASSTLLKLLNQGKYDEVPAQFLRWNKGGGKVLAGLVRRRKSEAHLFVTGELKTNF